MRDVKSMTGLVWWMRGVAILYLFVFVAATILRIPIRVEGPEGILEKAASGDPTSRFVVDTWVSFGLVFGVLGTALLIASRRPASARTLVWTVVAGEFVWGIFLDTYKISRGYDATSPVVWIIIHTLVIVTGVLFLRKTQSLQSPEG